MGKASVQKPWLKHFSPEARAAELRHETVYENLYRNNNAGRSDTAINYFDKKISYGELLDTADACAGALMKLGVKKGDYVICCSATVPEMAMALYGINKLGASMLALDPRRASAELKHFIVDSKAKVMILLDIAYDHLTDILPELNDIEKIVVISVDNYMPAVKRRIKQFKMPAPKLPYSDKLVKWFDFIAAGKGVETPTATYGEHEPAAVTLTGGTTGLPKGVMISNDGFNAVALSFMHCGVSYDRGHRFMDILPAFSSYGIVASLHMPLSLGLELIMIPKFNADKVGHYIKKYRPPHTLLVPAHYEKLMLSREMRHNFDLSFFKTAGSGGDTMNEGLETKLNSFLHEHGCNYPLSQGYGMSEASSAVSCCCNGNFKSLSVGYPLLQVTVGVFRPGTTEELDYGEEGEICVTGPTVMLGYFNNPKESEKVLFKHEDGQVWVHSGDLGCIDSDGYLFIKGRIKRLITRFDGHKIFPVQLEDIISRHESVESCAVVGVKDREHAMGMQALAVVKLHEGCDRAVIKEELYAMIADEAEERARPAFMEFVDEMPHAAMDKIDYKKLSEDFEKTQTA